MGIVRAIILSEKEIVFQHGRELFEVATSVVA